MNLGLLISVIFVFFFSALYSQNYDYQDSIFNKIDSSLPTNWEISLNEKTSELIIYRIDSVWIKYENKINALLNFESEKFDSSNMKKIQTRFIYKLESIWSNEKYQAVFAINDSLYKKISFLPQKYEIAHLYNKNLSRKGKEIYIPTNTQEEKRIENFYKEKTELEGSLIKLPDYQTEKYVVFTLEKDGITNNFTTVYPIEISEEIYNVMKIIDQTFLPIYYSTIKIKE